jgi:hypothetical protein
VAVDKIKVQNMWTDKRIEIKNGEMEANSNSSYAEMLMTSNLGFIICTSWRPLI